MLARDSSLPSSFFSSVRNRWSRSSFSFTAASSDFFIVPAVLRFSLMSFWSILSNGTASPPFPG